MPSGRRSAGSPMLRRGDRAGDEARQRAVAFLASGSLSHSFPTNALADQYLNRISTDFNAHMDRAVLPDDNVKCSGAGAMADTAMLFGVLRRDCTGLGEQLCEYFPSTGTGQVIVDFPLEPAITGPDRRAHPRSESRPRTFPLLCSIELSAIRLRGTRTPNPRIP